MVKDGEMVMPGERIGTAEEYLVGPCTYDDAGVIRAAAVGIVSIDTGEMVASVQPCSPVPGLEDGMAVIGEVIKVSYNLANVRVLCIDGDGQTPTGSNFGALHISRATEGFIRDLGTQFRPADIIRAEVAQARPALQLSTVREGLGVLKGFCGRCRQPLVKKATLLHCEACERTEDRRLAPDYGMPRV